jgi:hypothetical protein
MTAEAIEITGTIAGTETTETTEPVLNGRSAPCRFCDRPGAEGRHRAPGPLGPICPDCLDAGSKLCQDGHERMLGEMKLARLLTAPSVPCEFCGRSERRTLLRRVRPLPRMRCVQGEAVICADCLTRGSQLLAYFFRVRRS